MQAAQQQELEAMTDMFNKCVSNTSQGAAAALSCSPAAMAAVQTLSHSPGVAAG